ncbi:unnamed protein product [Cyclocybe aegerita]|uniref:Protein kinase domain-containing protein n=1 Tax=Cyclocybe aegerita TaxID=1973307 RepID=A0A8S0X6E7_CYCAE|nr:unnamed protein product [Cyclocybe aegerita]
MATSSRETTEDVVLKIYCSNLFPQEDPDTSLASLFGREEAPLYTEDLMSWTEVWAYWKLVCLQGSLVPRLCGAFMVKVPEEGRPANHFAVVITPVNGTSNITRCRALGGLLNGNRRWYPLARDLFKSVYQFHRLGICNLDLRDENIRVVRSAGNTESLVFFDFASARPSSFGSSEQKTDVQDALDRDWWDLYTIIAEICVYRTKDGDIVAADQRRWDFVKWLRKEHHRDEWLVAWDSRLDAMKPREGVVSTSTSRKDSTVS